MDGIIDASGAADRSDVLDLRPFEDHRFASRNASNPEFSDEESEEYLKQRLIDWVEQMMFVSGETAEPSAETTGMIEELVKQQVIEMVSKATPSEH
jgi:Transcription initiation factor IID, 18kD subunit